ncbi:MAG: ADP-ribosylglycohydrolase family protein [Planctomycetes bacterium]|nr:ADP-ribosylglycohydrolase family protein [Planctomycetota bacterium]
MVIAGFEDRVRGCLVGSVIGAELGYARLARPERFAVKRPEELFGLDLTPAGEVPETPHRIGVRRATPFIDLGIRAYVQKKGRVTPEDFGALLEGDAALAGPVFAWDGIHSVQELLKEGMSPRLTGLGAAPCGNIAASMPAVGIYHAGDSETAYLDGVELASVAQPRLGADWAGLVAAGVAMALEADASPESVVHAVLQIARQNNPDLFYDLNYPVRQGRALRAASEQEFLQWWLVRGGRVEARRETNWIASNPLSFVLPLLEAYGTEPEKMLAALLAAPNNGACIHAVVAASIAGALGGPAAFPAKWLAWSEPAALAWLPLIDVVRQRLEKEAGCLKDIRKLSTPERDGGSSLFDKIYGCLLAGAIGNAMGSPVEGRFYTEIDRQHAGGITTVLDPRRLESEDDNQMAMLLVETYLERDGLPVLARHFGKTWRERLNRDHFYPHCMGNAYDLIRSGWDPRITGHWSVVTGSTVMCMEPVGVYHPGDPEWAAYDAAAVSYMYQRGLDVTAAAVLAAAVAEAFRPEATVESVCEAALRTAPEAEMHTFDRRPFRSPRDYLACCLEVAARYDNVLDARAGLYERCLLYHHIDPLELLGLSLAMFRIARGDVRQAAIGGTNIGRDSDTIAGRAAMLSGTLRGWKTVPQDWIQLFRPEVLERIRRNAMRLAQMIAEKKASRMSRRQALASRCRR